MPINKLKDKERNPYSIDMKVNWLLKQLDYSNLSMPSLTSATLSLVLKSALKSMTIKNGKNEQKI